MYIHTYVYIYIHSIYIYIHTCVFVCVCVCVHIYNTPPNTYTCIYINKGGSMATEAQALRKGWDSIRAANHLKSAGGRVIGSSGLPFRRGVGGPGPAGSNGLGGSLGLFIVLVGLFIVLVEGPWALRLVCVCVCVCVCMYIYCVCVCVCVCVCMYILCVCVCVWPMGFAFSRRKVLPVEMWCIIGGVVVEIHFLFLCSRELPGIPSTGAKDSAGFFV